MSLPEFSVNERHLGTHLSVTDIQVPGHLRNVASLLIMSMASSVINQKFDDI